MAKLSYVLSKDEVVSLFMAMLSDDELPPSVENLLVELLNTVDDRELASIVAKWVKEDEVCIEDFLEIEEDQSIEIVNSPKAPAKKKAKKAKKAKK